MEPFTSLSVATSIIQIADFGAKLFAAGQEIYRDGSMTMHAEITAVAKDLEQLNQSLGSALASTSAIPTPLSEDEQKLLDFGRETAKAADEVIKLMESLVHRDGKSKAWKSFRQAFVAISSKKKVSELSEKLETLRNELILRVVVSLKLSDKFRLVREDVRYHNLEAEAKNIADALLDNKNFFTTGIRRLLRNQEDEARTAIVRQEETVAAIATLQGSMSKMATISDGLDRQSLPDLRKIQQDILDFLWFRFMRDRIEEVSAAYGATFQWVFDDKASSFWAWDNISSWLCRGNGCYWVNGKAGSGKSTFLKYIVDHPHTRELLNQWADGQSLLCARFFFWGAGTSLQKSQLGLLRSILYESLSQSPELIPIIFPIHCRQFARRQLIANEPSLLELKEAFKILTEQTLSPLKICLFIDGIDEYDGDHLLLVEFLRSVASSRTKLLLSSRPTPACLEAFAGCPSLQLQDLTQRDIRAYVNGNLGCYPRMWEVAQQNRSTIHDLCDDIVTKASGVFMWVVLVVRALRAGLVNYDTFTDLQARLDELPTDLDKLYAKMLSQMDTLYKRQAALLLQIMYQSTKVPYNGHMTSLRLSFASDANLDTAIDAPRKKITAQEIRRQCQTVEGLLRSRCCGLVEVRKPVQLKRARDTEDELTGQQFMTPPRQTDTGPIVPVSTQSLLHIIMQSTFADSINWTPQGNRVVRRAAESFMNAESDDVFEVHFLHKSVVDFLQKPEVWSQLQTLTSTTGFDPNVSLASASLREIKSAASEYDTSVDQSAVWPIFVRAMYECALAETSTGYSQELLLEELDATMEWHWRKIGGWIPRFGKSVDDMGHWSHLVPSVDASYHWNHGALPYDSMFSLACRFGLTKFVQGRLERSNIYPGKFASANLAQSALQRSILDINESSADQTLWNHQLEILEQSCRYGADVNVPFFHEMSAWQLALSRCNPRDLSSYEDWAAIIQVLVEGGADLNCATPEILNNGKVRRDCDFRVWKSSLDIIRDKFLSTRQQIGFRSRTSARKAQLIFEKLQSLLLGRNGTYRQWVEEETFEVEGGKRVRRWKIVSDPELKKNFLDEY